MKKISLRFVVVLALLFLLYKIIGEHQPVYSSPNHPTVNSDENRKNSQIIENSLIEDSFNDNVSIEPSENILSKNHQEDNLSEIPVDVTMTLKNKFNAPQVFGEGGWQEWIIVTTESAWEKDELLIVSEILATVIESLDQQSLDGRVLLSGYRFRRQPGEYINGNEGHFAYVNHTSQEIILADSAFKRLKGFYIIHELGHVVDQRSNRQLTANFHTLAGSDLDQRITRDGYWLNPRSQQDLEEATADAFALWIMTTYREGFRPVFGGTPLTANYEEISASLITSLDALSLAQ